MKVVAFFEFGDGAEWRWLWVERCWALFGLALIAATWRLWLPQPDFPQVPLLEFAGTLPPACQWAALTVTMLSLVAALVHGSRSQSRRIVWPFVTFVMGTATLVLFDQHRLQPWLYQFMIYAVVLGTVPSDGARRIQGLALLRILTLSIYLFSSLGKFDAQFLRTVGQQFLAVAWGFVGIDVDAWPWSTRLLLAATFPLVELILVVLLAVPRLRRVGVGTAVVLHVALVVMLGPWGLHHELGVLLWNLFFVTQVVLLFFGTRTTTATAETTAPNSCSVSSHEPAQRHWLPTGVVLAVVCLPLLEPLGWFDHWPSWGLYSPRNSRAVVEVHRAGLKNLPAELQPFLAPAAPNASWVRLEIDAWSLAALSVPIYPQDRFQLGVAESIATRYGLDRTIRVRLLGMANRFSGERKETVLMGRQQVMAAAARFRLNAHPAPNETLPRTVHRPP